MCGRAIFREHERGIRDTVSGSQNISLLDDYTN